MVDILRTFEAIKVFTKEESDTFLGLILYTILGLGVVNYIFGSIFEQTKIYLLPINLSLLAVILIVWIINRHIPITENKFTIGIAPFNLLLLKAKTELTSESKRDLKRELVDYIYSSLHFNKEKLYLDKYIEIVRLPNRIKPNHKNAKKWTRRLKTDLLIWGETYYENDNLHFKPRFEFLVEPNNTYYHKFKKGLNELKSFKIKTTDSVENQKTELSQLMHYISFLGMMFQGIFLSHSKKFEEAKEAFDHSLHEMHDKAFQNKTLSDIYLATRFFAAQNYHKWGEYLLEKNKNDPKALDLYTQGAEAFFARAKEMEKLKDSDSAEKIEHSLLYGIFLLMKKGDTKKADEKLESIKKQFDKKTIYLYHLYKGLMQRTTAKAKPFFDKAIKTSKNNALVYEKIADFFFSKGKTKESIKYFKERLNITEQKIYAPTLLEEDIHEKLSIAYAKEAKFISAIREKALAESNKQKNIEDKRTLAE